MYKRGTCVAFGMGRGLHVCVGATPAHFTFVCTQGAPLTCSVDVDACVRACDRGRRERAHPRTARSRLAMTVPLGEVMGTHGSYKW